MCDKIIKFIKNNGLKMSRKIILKYSGMLDKQGARGWTGLK
jgi:hypothetical protein